MRGFRGNVLLVVLAVLTVGTAGFALERPQGPAAYNGPQARGTVDAPVVYPQVAFIGDSYTGGSEMGGNGANGWPVVLTNKHRWYPTILSVGGSGLLTPGSGSTTFVERLPQLRALQPQLLVIWPSRNDTASAAELGSAMADLLTKAKHDLPKTRLVVIGPAWTSGDVPAAFSERRDAFERSASAAGAAFIDPLAENWFGGERQSLIGSDGIHPTDAGHRFLADRIDQDLIRLGLAKLPKPAPAAVG